MTITIPRVTSYQLLTWALVFLGVFLFGYTIGYYTGADQVNLATVECSTGWRGTLDTLADCAHNVAIMTEQNSKLAENCGRLADKAAKADQCGK